ncbi:MAG: tail fiber protein [Myxococcales bacterium]
MADPFVAEIRIFPYNFAPKGWAACDGQLLPISQNTALFSLLGTMYGGNGITTFALPDLRGRIPLQAGQGAGLSSYTQGQTGGSDTVTLLPTNLPSHTHAVNALDAGGSAMASASPASTTVFGPSQARARSTGYATPTSASAPPPATMNASAVASTGDSQPHSNLSPYVTFTFCIALQGIFPSRS